MKFQRFTVASMLVIAAMGIASGTAYADPAPAPDSGAAQSPDGVDYAAHIEDKTVVTTLDGGVFKLTSDGKAVGVHGEDGKLLVSLPLAYQLDNLRFPFEEKISEDGKTLELTPGTDPAKATPIAVKGDPGNLALSSIASPKENLTARQNFSSQLGIATAVGGLTGMLVGATVGTIAGCIFGLGIGCLPGLATGASVGSVVGTIVAGGPTLVIAGLELNKAIAAPEGTTQFADSTK